MENSDISYKLIRKNEKINMKYRYDNSKLKGNRIAYETKLFSPQRQSEMILNPNDLTRDYSVNHLKVKLYQRRIYQLIFRSSYSKFSDIGGYFGLLISKIT